MPGKQHVALLRGINVGGRNPVSMADLRGTFEEVGYGRVRTWIQSGNVLFESDRPTQEIEGHLEASLQHHLEGPVVVVVRSERQLRAVVAGAPEGFGAEPGTYHSDAVFLKGPLTSAQAMRVVETREGVDRAWAGKGVVYFQRLSARRTASRMSRMIGTPEYQRMTIRSWSTTRKLVDLLDAPA